jgi:SAM-dependent methyltransferase
VKVCPECRNRFSSEEWICPRCSHQPPVRDGVRLFVPELLADPETYDREAFDLLARLESGHYWFEARRELIVWALGRYFPRARSMLEIGCGTGFVLEAIHRAAPALSLTGTDLYPEGLGLARSRVPAADFCQLDAAQIPYQDEFDVVGSFDVLEHIDDDEAVLASIAGSLRPGGGLIATVPQHPRMWSAADDYAKHRRRYTRSELVAKTRRAGLEVERLTSFMFFLLPFMAVARLIDRRRESFDIEDELRMGAGVNGVLLRILAFERALIRRGVSFPAGGSLLLVARARG